VRNCRLVGCEAWNKLRFWQSYQALDTARGGSPAGGQAGRQLVLRQFPCRASEYEGAMEELIR
jgi:hypothetical protein